MYFFFFIFENFLKLFFFLIYFFFFFFFFFFFYVFFSLYNNFNQHIIATIFTESNQYRIILQKQLLLPL